MPKKPQKDEIREMVYPELKVVAHVFPDTPVAPGMLREGPMTAEIAAKLLGVQIEPEDAADSFGDKFMFKVKIGDKLRPVRCVNNSKNRMFTPEWSVSLGQDQLNKHWKLNGQTIVIGQYGQILSGQHELAALYQAQRAVDGKNKAHWSDYWPDGIVQIETIVVYGVNEDPDTTATIDFVKPRTFADCLFTQSAFGNKSAKDQQTLCRMADHAVRMLWRRIGNDDSAFSAKRTNIEAAEFFGRHPSLAQCVMHIAEENKAGVVSKYFPAGYAAGVMYLQMMSATPEEDVAIYRNKLREYDPAKMPSERDLEKDYDKAAAFWTLLCAVGNPDGSDLRSVIRPVLKDDKGVEYAVNLHRDDKMVILAKAWALFKENKPMKADDIRPIYKDTPEGKEIDENPMPNFGGVDVGMTTPDSGSSGKDGEGEELNEDEIESRKAEQRNGRSAKGQTATDDGLKFSVSLADVLKSLREDHKDAVFVFRNAKGYIAYGNDSANVGEALGEQRQIDSNLKLPFLAFTTDKLQKVVSKIPNIKLVEARPDGSANVQDPPKAAKGKPSKKAKTAT
jgi:hypothetical protein